MMYRIRILVLVILFSVAAFAGTGRNAKLAVISNLVQALNYNKYELFLKDASPEFRKSMTRANYDKLHSQMMNYIGHIVNWKLVTKHNNGKMETYSFRLTGDSETIGLIMLVQMYAYDNKILVYQVAFSKR